MKPKYFLLIISKTLRPKFDYRYCIVRFNSYSHENILETDSLCEVKMWLDLKGLKFHSWKQEEYHFSTGIDGIKLILHVELES